jgi:hypothetical protein
MEIRQHRSNRMGMSLTKYPADTAFDYKEGDLQGIWHVMFSKNNHNMSEIENH